MRRDPPHRKAHHETSPVRLPRAAHRRGAGAHPRTGVSATALDALGAPTDVQAVHVADTGADLWWNGDVRSDEAVIERKVGGTWSEFARGAFGALHLAGLQPGTGYTLRIYLVAAGYTAGPPSAPVSFTTLTGPDGVAPSAPGSMLFSSITTTGVSLLWGESTDNVEVTGYHLQQLVGGAWTTIRTVDAFSRFQRVTGLSAGTSVCVRGHRLRRARQHLRPVSGVHRHHPRRDRRTDLPGPGSSRSAPASWSPSPSPTPLPRRSAAGPCASTSPRPRPPPTSSAGRSPAPAAPARSARRRGAARSAPAGSSTAGFSGNATPFTPPESFTLNGTPCTVA